ncbi:trimeric LpxA-like protein [Aspergillus ellipticus CBS 707.79]|uniref:Trimeric LpxA-like protein n=1 Tax=Aspergillus ellipticus CBS 707.79 TaxID=1448320 RepID=A0A319DEQ0_9EURO|nr:trimeric LpxA-like protein [Aspergillus ellipticus CBS 707.79]
MDMQENRDRMRCGELFHAFVPDLVADRIRCAQACRRFNNAGDVSRRRLLELWKDIIGDKSPLPPPSQDPVDDDEILKKQPWVEPPIRIDYGYNVRVGEGAFINFDCVILDPCLVTIGARTLCGPKLSIYSGTHPLDPAVRNGTEGPELGKEIHIGEDCWLGGNVTVLPGVTIGKGVVIGAGSVVTKVGEWLAISCCMFKKNKCIDDELTMGLGCACISSGRGESSKSDSQDRDVDDDGLTFPRS